MYLGVPGVLDGIAESRIGAGTGSQAHSSPDHQDQTHSTHPAHPSRTLTPPTALPGRHTGGRGLTGGGRGQALSD